MIINISKLAAITSCLVALSACGGGGGGGNTNFTVNTTTNTGGSVSPSSASVEEGSSTSITLTADTGFRVTDATGCNGTLSGNSYTTGSITSDCTITVTFTADTTTTAAVWDAPEATWDNILWQ